MSALPTVGEESRRYLLNRLPHSMEEMLRFPKYVDFDVVNVCNARCVMCGIDFDGRRGKRMPAAVFEKIARELEEQRGSVERIGLVVNCEPLLDRHLEAKVRRLRSPGMPPLFINTNASLLSEKRARGLLEAGIDVVYLSIDSMDAGRFEEIRVGLDFREVFENARRFIELKAQIRPETRCRITMVLQDKNRDEAESFADYWEPLLGANDEVVVTRGYNWGLKTDVAPNDARANRHPCISLWTSCAIDVAGDVSLCCADQSGSVVLGNVLEESIAEIWRGPRMQACREKHLQGLRGEIPICSGCTVWTENKHAIHRRGSKGG